MAALGWWAPAGVAAGSLLALAGFSMQAEAWICGLLLAPVALLRPRWLVAAALVAFGCAWFSLHERLGDRLWLAPDGETVEVTGRVLGLPQPREDFTRFLFAPHPLSFDEGGSQQLPSRVLAYWHRDAPELRPGQAWRLRLQLRPPWGRVNFQGNDPERWYFAQGIGALATVRSGELLPDPFGILTLADRVRQVIRERLQDFTGDARGQGMVAALAIADRNDLQAMDQDVMTVTGTAHLLSISGLHVAMAALCGCWLAGLVLLAHPTGVGALLRQRAMLLAGWVTAAVYTALAGFEAPTVRSLVMLSMVFAAQGLRRSVHPGQALLLALALLLLLDPAAPLQAGFWLSFLAVGALLAQFAPRRGLSRRFGARLVFAQLGVSLMLLPLGAFWFQSASIVGLLANLVAIPWVSFCVIPLILLALLLLAPAPGLSAALCALAGSASVLLLDVLEWLAALPLAALPLAPPTAWDTVWASFGAALLLLPRGIPARWLGLLLLVPVLLPAPRPAEGELRVEVLDVGQGTSVLAQTREGLLLYDSGPGDGRGFDLVDSVIVPAVSGTGHAAPDQVIISHGDLDHAGGWRGVRQRYPAAGLHANLADAKAGVEPCNQGLSWSKGQLELSALHPTPYLPYLGNDSSCVISLLGGQNRVLLPGDISGAVEQRLVRQGLDPHTLLLVPHHGSDSSSTAEFLAALRPSLAIATTGLGNRFGFPRPDARERYRAEGVRLLSTDACGAIQVLFSREGRITLRSARRERPAPWRWPAGVDCP